ncbi:putative GST-like protein YibF [bacterium HR40]|nr:putative GST-like protein YibF [bacterium HR40]
MRLHTNPASPFGRKVMVTAHELGLADRITVENRAVTPVQPNEAVVADNPLGKLPTLVLDDGTPLYDSRVICEYLDSLAGGGRILPRDGMARFRTFRLQALADGMMEAGVLTRYETFLRPEELRWHAWVEHQKLKITRALDWLEAHPAEYRGEGVDLGRIALGCALGYLDFRFGADRWRDGRPQLAAWFEGFATRPSMQATIPHQL